MANIRIDLPIPAFDGQTVAFKAPCHASNVTGLNIYTTVDGVENYTAYTFADAHGNNLADIDELFAAGAVVKVVLDTEERKAFVQNPDTNAYLEAKFEEVRTLANSKAAASHTHDDRYYTETEVNSLLSAKAASSHTHAASGIKAGTFAATDVKAAAGTDYTTARVRNIKFSDTDVTAGSTSSDGNGSLLVVYEVT